MWRGLRSSYSSSEGLCGGSVERWLHGWERESNSTGSGAQGAMTQPRIRPPPGQAEARRAQDSNDALARAQQISSLTPEPPDPADGLFWSYCGG